MEQENPAYLQEGKFETMDAKKDEHFGDRPNKYSWLQL